MSDERRLWREDNMAWAIAPAEIEAGQRFTWAGKFFLVTRAADTTLRVREIKPKE